MKNSEQRIKFIFLIATLIAGYESYCQQKISLNINPGINISHLNIDSIQTNNQAAPYFGAGLGLNFNKYHFRLSNQISYRKAKSDHPFYVYRNIYNDWSFLSYYDLNHFIKIGGGIQYSILQESKVKKLAPLENTGVKLFNTSGFSSRQTEVIIGTEINLQRGIDLSLRYTPPVNQIEYNNFQIGLTYELLGGNFSTGRKESIKAKRQQALDIQRNAVFVRLSSKANTLAALEQYGKMRRFRKIKEKRDKINQKLMESFSNYFDFSPVFFFYDFQTENILNKDYTVLFNSKNQPIDAETQSLISDNFYIAEYSTTEPDSTKYFMRYGYFMEENPEDEVVSFYYHNTNNHIRAIILRDKNLNQLNSPFPYHTKCFGRWAIRRSVRRLNRKLKNSY